MKNTLRSFIHKILLEATEPITAEPKTTKPGYDEKGNFIPAPLLKMKADLEKQKKEREVNIGAAEEISQKVTMDPVPEVFSNTETSHTINKYKGNESKVKELGKELKTKIPTLEKEGWNYDFPGDVVYLANLHAAHIAETGRKSDFSFNSFRKSQETFDDAYTKNEKGKIAPNEFFTPKGIDKIARFVLPITNTQHSIYFRYILEVLASAYKGKKALSNGVIYEKKVDNGETIVIEKRGKVEIDAPKENIAAAIAAFFQISSSPKNTPMDSYLTTIIQSKTKGAMSIQAIKMDESPDEVRESLMYGWMKLFGPAKDYTVTDDTNFSEEEEAEIKKIENTDTLSKNKGTSFMYYAFLGMASNVLNYFILKRLKSKYLQGSIDDIPLGHLPPADGAKSDITTKILTTNPNYLTDFREANEKIYRNLGKTSSPLKTRAFYDLMIAMKPSSEAFMDSVKEASPEFDFLLNTLNFRKFKNDLELAKSNPAPIQEEKEIESPEFDLAMKEAQGIENMQPIFDLANKYGIALKAKTGAAAHLRDLAKKYDAIYKEPNSPSRELYSLFVDKQTGELTKKGESAEEIYAQYPIFTKQVEDISPGGANVLKTVSALNLKSRDMYNLGKQAGTQYGAKIMDTFKDENERYKSSEYQKWAKAKREKRTEKGIVPGEEPMTIEDFYKEYVTTNRVSKQEIKDAKKRRRGQMLIAIEVALSDAGIDNVPEEELEKLYKGYKTLLKLNLTNSPTITEFTTSLEKTLKKMASENGVENVDAVAKQLHNQIENIVQLKNISILKDLINKAKDVESGENLRLKQIAENSTFDKFDPKAVKHHKKDAKTKIHKLEVKLTNMQIKRDATGGGFPTKEEEELEAEIKRLSSFTD